jgi:hypothetical protein
MSFSRVPPAVSFALALALGACDNSSFEVSSTNSGATNSSATNLGISALAITGADDLRLVAVTEVGQRVDLNGDGDRLDAVLHVYDAVAGTLENLGLAVTGTPGPRARLVADGRAAFTVDEAAQGADLDGDGDLLDRMLHLFDVRKPTIENLGFALTLPSAARLEGGLLLFAADEAAQGVDLDGDGLLNGEVAFVRDFTRGTTPNLRQPLGSAAMRASDRRAAFLVAETSATGDLNGDGDVLDRAVLQVYDGVRGLVVGSGLATNGAEPLLASGFVTVLVSEAEQGADLDGDGDLLDRVYFDFDPISGLARSLVLEGPRSGSVEGENALALIARERTNGDLDGDGDQADFVPFLYEPLRGRLTNLGLAEALGIAPLFLERSLVLIVSEAANRGLDLDGDGDALDLVPHVFDLVNRTITNLAVAGTVFRAADGRLLFARSEAQAQVDWNRDGDQLDSILFAWDEATTQLVNSGLASVGVLDARGSRVLLVQSEEEQDQDLNGDGDRVDFVLASYDFTTGLASNIGLAASLEGVLLSETAALVLVPEIDQGRDLNGDGDFGDSVLHRVELGR